ncbi:hypothetical protein Tco_0183582, partial [Tanacetum coccineum]
ELEAFSDSDYRGASLDRKSTTSGCQFLCRRLISWQCKKQTIVANSTTEEEYVAAANYCGQVLWIQNQMMGYGFNFMNIKIHIDNKSTISVSKNPVAHLRTKHIEIRFHFIRDYYEKRLIEHWIIEFVATIEGRQDDLLESLERDIDGTKELLLPDLFILWLTKVSTDSAKCSYGTRSYEAPLPEGNTSGSVEDSMQLKELMDIVPKLVTRIETLETELQQTKTTYGKAVLTLVKRVKILEKALKRKTQKVVISESEGEEPEDQGRIIQDIDDDPLVSLVRESMKMKEKSTDFVTPTKASGEAQEEDISPTILEAAKTLSKVASQGVSKVKSTDKGKRYRRRARSVAKNINTGLDAEEEINEW